MAVPVDVGVYARGGEDQHEEEHCHGGTVELAFYDWAQQVDPVPVQDYVPKDHPDHAEESSRSTRTQEGSFVYGVAEDVARDAREQVDAQCFGEPEGVLYPGHQKESAEDVAQKVQQVNVHKDGGHQSPQFHAVPQRGVVVRVVHQSGRLDFQQVA